HREVIPGCKRDDPGQIRKGETQMKRQKLVKMGIVCAEVLAAILALSNRVQAEQNWNATVGGQSADMSKQAVAFLPNEIWIHAGGSITWTFARADIHSAT